MYLIKKAVKDDGRLWPKIENEIGCCQAGKGKPHMTILGIECCAIKAMALKLKPIVDDSKIS